MLIFLLRQTKITTLQFKGTGVTHLKVPNAPLCYNDGFIILNSNGNNNNTAKIFALYELSCVWFYCVGYI